MANSKYIYIVGENETESVKEAAKLGKIPLSSLKAGFKKRDTFERNGIIFERKPKNDKVIISVTIDNDLNLIFNTHNEFYGLN